MPHRSSRLPVALPPSTGAGATPCPDATWPQSWIQRENWEFETHRRPPPGTGTPRYRHTHSGLGLDNGGFPAVARSRRIWEEYLNRYGARPHVVRDVAGSRPPWRRGRRRSACVVDGRLRQTGEGTVKRAPPRVLSRTVPSREKPSGPRQPTPAATATAGQPGRRRGAAGAPRRTSQLLLPRGRTSGRLSICTLRGRETCRFRHDRRAEGYRSTVTGASTGACPIPASSGVTNRHRLFRGGHRQANATLYRIVIVRMRWHQPTIDYVARRTAQGLSKKDIIRCLKRFVAREIYNALIEDHRLRAAHLEAA